MRTGGIQAGDEYLRWYIGDGGFRQIITRSRTAGVHLSARINHFRDFVAVNLRYPAMNPLIV